MVLKVPYDKNMQRIEKRGVVVYVSPQGEANKRVGLYTEEGMLYFTIYGARSSKGHTKSALSLFTMGRFVFSTGDKSSLRFVDVNIYEMGTSISEKLEVYYAACTAAEVVKTAIGAEHEMQFKLLVDYLLFLIHCPQFWTSGLALFLWRSLVYNGWQPETPDFMHNISYKNTHISKSNKNIKSEDIQNTDNMVVKEGNICFSYSISDGFLALYEKKVDANGLFFQYSLIELFIKSDSEIFGDVCMKLNNFTLHELQDFISILFSIWHNILGYKLKLSNFVLH